MSLLKKIEAGVSSWPGVTVHAHRFGGREFRVGRAEIGHVHTGGTVDIPFPRTVHDAMLAGGLAREHRWVPGSGWISFDAREEADLAHALWLLRLSYVRYALKEVPEPREFFKRECESLQLSLQLKALLEPFMPKRPKHAAAATSNPPEAQPEPIGSSSAG